MSDDEWGDDDLINNAPKILMTCRVIKDFKPEEQEWWDPRKPDLSVIPLELDNLVYIFKKSASRNGYWEGECKGICGSFPSNHVEEVCEDETKQKKKL